MNRLIEKIVFVGFVTCWRLAGAPTIPLALGSLGLAIPLIGAAGGLAGVAGVIAVCIAIVLVNLLWVFGRD